ncbi:hypothetical protein SLEP1_g58270 [Rubroshorea leprosula]|uniref:Uncharacterized protein n=1 Tax=Rubroshorea leprosula TaxID=152421 RepID=A0AAV5MPU6_9ROSI|nr:hypothetical protein SLEP1_g58270 [Rubroshorea leprosula]
MASSHNAQGFRGNQGEDEEVGVISVEPITMIVPPELQDSPRPATLENSTSSSTSSGSEDHRPSTSSDSPVEGTSGEVRGVEEVGCSASVMSTATEILRTILIRVGTPNDRACSVSRTGWVPVYVDHFDAGLRFPLPGLIFDVLAKYELALSQLTPNSIKFSGTRWYYISGREKMMIFSNIRNKVARWMRQFVFVRDTQPERISNELAARLSEWRTPNSYMNYPQLTAGDVDLKNQLLDYVKARGLVDLEALVTPEQIALLGFVNVANLHSQASLRGNVNEHKARRAGELGPARSISRALTSGHLLHQGAAPSIEVPARHKGLVLSRELSLRHPALEGAQGRTLTQRMTFHSPGGGRVPARSLRRRLLHDRATCPQLQLMRSPSRHQPCRYAELCAPCRPAAREGAYSATWGTCCSDQANGCVQLHCRTFRVRTGARVQNLELEHNCKQLASEKASLVDEVSRLQSSEMANRAASVESRADQLARKVDELKEELQRAQVEKESGIQAAKEETDRAEDRAKKAESKREKTLHELSALRERVSQADQHVAQAEASLESTKRLYQHDICFARAQGAEWLVGAEMFQDAVAVASANTTTDIFNEVRGKVLQVQADFPIGELAFFEGEEINAEGKSLAPPADTRVRLRWELNEEGLPVWPPSVIEEGEDTEGLPSFDAWVANPHDVHVEPSRTPPSARSHPAPASSPALSPALPPPDRSSSTRPATAPNDASIPVDLTDD